MYIYEYVAEYKKNSFLQPNKFYDDKLTTPQTILYKSYLTCHHFCVILFAALKA